MVIRNKKVASVALSLAIVVSSFTGVTVLAAESVSAAQVQLSEYREVKVIIDGTTQTFSQPAVIVDGSTLVPMRGVFESLGATIKWDNATRTVTATKDKTTIVLTIGKNYAHVNGTKVVLAKEALILNGSTMVPLRFVAEALGSKVGWDAPTYTATITSKTGSGTGVTAPTPTTNPSNPTSPTSPSTGTGSSYVVSGIDATQTKGRLYGSTSQSQYDQVVKIAKDALAKLDSVEIPKALTDYLYHGKVSTGANNFYDLELEGFANQLKPFLDAGVSADTLLHDYKVGVLISELIGQSYASTAGVKGIDSAYDALVKGLIDCDSGSQAASLIQDLAGYQTAIVAESNHAYLIYKLDSQWTTGGRMVGKDPQAYLKTVQGGYWLVAPN